jgi:hypothetical protein
MESRKYSTVIGGSQITCSDFTGVLLAEGIQIIMDGKGRHTDNIFVERYWRSKNYEEVYPNDYANVAESWERIGKYIDLYNTERPHQSVCAQNRFDINRAIRGIKQSMSAIDIAKIEIGNP